MDDDYPSCFFGESPQERRDWVAEMAGSAEGWEEMGRELVLGIRVWRRRVERRDEEVKEVYVFYGIGVPALDSKRGLAVVCRSTNIVDGDVVGGDKAGEVEELVDMALSRQGHHDNHHFMIMGWINNVETI